LYAKLVTGSRPTAEPPIEGTFEEVVMAFEVDMLGVGQESRSGDAMALRFGNLFGRREEQTVVVIDGGTKDSGEELVAHIKQYYGTDRVDLVISTHMDCDHVNGLKVVVEKMKVGSLLLHQPWDHAADIKRDFRDHRFTVTGLSTKIERALADASELEDIAERKGVKIVEPFAGAATTDGSIHVLGPSKDYYCSLVCDFRKTPTAKTGVGGFLTRAAVAVQEAVTWVRETLDKETLDDSGKTSAENNSSAIVLFTIDGHKLLFTGDAGIDAMSRAADYAESIGISLSDLRFLDVPHHGSRRNLGPTILNRVKAKTAYISVARKSEKHPSKKVVNALIRRGASVYSTCGTSLWHHSESVPARDTYSGVTPLPFSDYVEE
jgi:beta-lactamase superfamily II metal-dependent hydrolase